MGNLSLRLEKIKKRERTIAFIRKLKKNTVKLVLIKLLISFQKIIKKYPNLMNNNHIVISIKFKKKKIKKIKKKLYSFKN